MKEILTAVDAAKILMIRPQAVREHMKHNIYPFSKVGAVVKGKDKSQYLIYSRRFLELFGIPEDVAERRLDEGC